jgi:hypothetical protein
MQSSKNTWDTVGHTELMGLPQNLWVKSANWQSLLWWRVSSPVDVEFIALGSIPKREAVGQDFPGF